MCIRTADFTDDELADMGGQVAAYKSFRDVMVAGSAALRTSQAAVTGGPSWDAVQISAADGARVVIDAFQADLDSAPTTITPFDLDPTATYDVRSLDTGPLGEATGADLVNGGIDVGTWTDSAAHILVLTRRGQSM